MARSLGAAALARELGADRSNVAHLMQRGMTPDQIRAKYEARTQLKKRGIGLRGKPMSEAPPKAKEGLASEENRGCQVEPDMVEIPIPDYFRKSDPASVEKQANSLAEVKLRKETALAIATELSNAQRAGDLLPATWVKSWCGEAIAKFRDMVWRMPTELRDRLAVESDPFVVEELLRAELKRALGILERMQWPNQATG
jgi:hypothetical protein